MQDYVPVYIQGDRIVYGSVRPGETKTISSVARNTLAAEWQRESMQQERPLRLELHNGVLRVVVTSCEVADKLVGFRRSPLHPSWKPAR